MHDSNERDDQLVWSPKLRERERETANLIEFSNWFFFVRLSKQSDYSFNCSNCQKFSGFSSQHDIHWSFLPPPPVVDVSQRHKRNLMYSYTPCKCKKCRRKQWKWECLALKSHAAILAWLHHAHLHLSDLVDACVDACVAACKPMTFFV